jgi:hypothetical protein
MSFHVPRVMPALVAGIHVFTLASKQDVDGQGKPGQDGTQGRRQWRRKS